MLSTRALVARAAKLLAEVTKSTDWKLYSEMFDVTDIAENAVPRLHKSQFFSDPDYPDRVMEFFKKIVERDESLAIQFIKYVLAREPKLDDEKTAAKDPELLQQLGLISASLQSQSNIVVKKEYLTINAVPSDFYSQLQKQINRCHAAGVLSAVQILSRKFMENLIIDILRRKYGTGNIELFYDTKKRRFHGFEVLLANLDKRIDDFMATTPAFNREFLKKINKYREQGNSSAHTIELDLKDAELEKDAQEIEYIINVLIRVFSFL